MDSHTLIQALIYLGAAALIVPVAVRLGLGSVLGYLIAGYVIGPWGFRLVTDAEAILHFAEIGVVLMLFVIGLELDPQRLWKLRASVFGGGALQMAACGLLLGGFCILLGMDWKVAELIGMTLALSSTAIAMQAMNERNLTVSQMGRSAFSVLLFQDIAAIPLVAMIPLLAASGASTTLGAFALSALKVVGALALVVRCFDSSPAPGCGKCSVPWRCSWCLVLVCCWRKPGCRWRWEPSSRAFYWPAQSTDTRLKVISSHLKDCCWGCFSSGSGCLSTLARWSRIHYGSSFCWSVSWSSKW